MGCTQSAKTGHMDDEGRDVFSMDEAPADAEGMRRIGSRRRSNLSSRRASGALSPKSDAGGGDGHFVHITAGVIKDKAGKNAGRLDKQGAWYGADNDKRGSFKKDGSVRDAAGAMLARIDDDGQVWSARRKVSIGRIARDGSVLASSSVVGHVTADGAAFDARGRRVGMCSAGKAQAAFIFFFEDRVSGKVRSVVKAASR
mmetsp:Transcript_9629/g.33855  ORF Transcript_9629/g.33855 Transcript_9629/m.33855 type:complete len:200 (-) Transcript_9629:792-1391(-)